MSSCASSSSELDFVSELDFESALQKVVSEYHSKNYRESLKLSLSLYIRAKLSPQQENDVLGWMLHCYNQLEKLQAALPYARRLVTLALQLHVPRSFEHAVALCQLGIIYHKVGVDVKARKALNAAISMMVELGRQKDKDVTYGDMILRLGQLDASQSNWKDAIVHFEQAKEIFIQHKNTRTHTYGSILTDLMACYEKLDQWSEVIEHCKLYIDHCKTFIGDTSTKFAIALDDFATALVSLKQYEQAIPVFERALAIYQSNNHPYATGATEDLDYARQTIQVSDRRYIDVGHYYGMCNQCGIVKNNMDMCTGCYQVWYCSTDCQSQHWVTHKPSCKVCWYCSCSATLTKQLRCKRCKNAKYCGFECQKADWVDHKKDCRKTI